MLLPPVLVIVHNEVIGGALDPFPRFVHVHDLVVSDLYIGRRRQKELSARHRRLALLCSVYRSGTRIWLL
jgi:hypothetical protein